MICRQSLSRNSTKNIIKMEVPSNKLKFKNVKQYFMRWIEKWYNNDDFEYDPSKIDISQLTIILHSIGFKVQRIGIADRNEKDVFKTDKAIRLTIECGSSRIRTEMRMTNVVCGCPCPRLVETARLRILHGLEDQTASDGSNPVEEFKHSLFFKTYKSVVRLNQEIIHGLLKFLKEESFMAPKAIEEEQTGGIFKDEDEKFQDSDRLGASSVHSSDTLSSTQKSIDDSNVADASKTDILRLTTLQGLLKSMPQFDQTKLSETQLLTLQKSLDSLTLYQCLQLAQFYITKAQVLQNARKLSKKVETPTKTLKDTDSFDDSSIHSPKPDTFETHMMASPIDRLKLSGGLLPINIEQKLSTRHSSCSSVEEDFSSHMSTDTSKPSTSKHEPIIRKSYAMKRRNYSAIYVSPKSKSDNSSTKLENKVNIDEVISLAKLLLSISSKSDEKPQVEAEEVSASAEQHASPELKCASDSSHQKTSRSDTDQSQSSTSIQGLTTVKSSDFKITTPKSSKKKQKKGKSSPRRSKKK